MKDKIMRWSHPLADLLALLLLTPCTRALGAVLEVPAEYTTIQSAIDASMTGDTILVAAGVYTGDGNRDLDPAGKEIVILSESGPDLTILDCEGTVDEPHRAMWVRSGEGNGLVFDGFTVRNGSTAKTGSTLDRSGGGVLISVGFPILRNLVVEGCYASKDGAAVSGPVIIENSRFQDCSGSRVIDKTGGRLELRDSTIGPNSAPGLRAWGKALIERVAIVGNDSYGVSASPVDFVMIDSIIAGNDGASIYVQGTGSGSLVSGCTVTGNRGEAFLNADIAVENTVYWGNGGPIYVEAGWDVVIDCCAFDPIDIQPFGDPPTFIGDQVSVDPLFCEAIAWQDAPTMAGDFRIDSASPCSAHNSPCGALIGALDVGCGAASTDTELHQLRLLSPNPVTSELRFFLATSVKGGEEIEGEILDLAGRRVAWRRLDSTYSPEFRWSLEGSELSAGIYFLRVTDGLEGARTTKFVWLGR